ncbi:MAG: glycosidase, partial [Chloroflexota bacterium]
FRLGAGTPPLRLAEGWLTIYHGVELLPHAARTRSLRYNAAALIMDHVYPRRIVYRSPLPTLEPQVAEERCGVVSNVVFPTAVDHHDTHVDVYYGMADTCIGVARMDLRPPLTMAELSPRDESDEGFPEELSA